MQTISLQMSFNAPIERLWAMLIDYEGYASFPKIEAARVVTRGADHPAGVGAVRELRVDGMTFSEQIVEFDPPRRLAYRITASRPLKLRHDIGRMELTERDGRVDLTWSSTFAVDVPIVGGLLTYVARFGMERTFRAILLHVKSIVEQPAK